MTKKTYAVKDMHCANCVMRIEGGSATRLTTTEVILLRTLTRMAKTRFAS